MATGRDPGRCRCFGAPSNVLLRVALGIAVLVVPVRGLAEGVTVAGLSFPVDAIVGVDDRDVTVRLGGKETVIRRTDLERFVVEETLADRTLTERLDARALLRFAEESLKAGDGRRAGLAFRVLRWRPELNEDDLLESLDVLNTLGVREEAHATLAQVALVPVFEPERYPRLTARLVILAGTLDPAWVRQHTVPYTYGIKRPIQERLERELADRLRLRDIEGAGKLVRFSREVYGAEDPASQRLGMWLERVTAVVEAAREGDIEALGKALLVESSDPDLGAILSPVAMEGLHKAATLALDGGSPEKALEILSRVDLLKRSQTTHELTGAALDGILAQRNSILLRPDILTYLDFISRNDPGLANTYAEKLRAQISVALDEGNVSESEMLLERLKPLSAASPEMVEEVLVRQAEVYLAQGMHGLAERKVRESGATGFAALWLQCRLSIATMPATTLGVFLAVFFILVALLTLSIVRGRRRALFMAAPHSAGRAADLSGSGGIDGSFNTDSEEEDEDAPRGFVVNELRRLSPSAQEYQRGLEMLGLTANADLRAIKNAYRKLVKDVHPDHNKANDEAAANRFIELTRAYDRILELRKEFGYED